MKGNQSGGNTGSLALTALESVLNDESITEILICENTPMSVWRAGALEERGSPFAGQQLLPALKRIAQNIGSPLGRSRHCVSGTIASGWFVTICDGKESSSRALLNARKLPVLGDDSLESLQTDGVIDQRLAKMLAACIETRSNVIVVGNPRCQVRAKILSALASHWAENHFLLTIDHPFLTPTEHPRAHALESNDIFQTDANLGEVLVASDPSADTLTSMLMMPQRTLLGIDGDTMSQAINTMVSYLSYVRPGMILKGVESLLTSRVDLLVLCDSQRVTALGESQYWQDRLTVRALAQWSPSGYLCDLRGSRLRERLLAKSPDLIDSAAQDLEVRSEDEEGQPLGVTPLVTSIEQRRVSDEFISDNEERSFQELGESDRLKTPVISHPEATSTSTSASVSDEELGDLPDAPEYEDYPASQVSDDVSSELRGGAFDDSESELEPVVPQSLGEEDAEIHTEIGSSVEAAPEAFVDDMPSRTYNLADEAEAVSEEIELPEVSAGSVHSRMGQVENESQATMIINQAEIDVAEQLAPSSLDVSEGPGRSDERTRNLDAQRLRRKS